MVGEDCVGELCSGNGASGGEVTETGQVALADGNNPVGHVRCCDRGSCLIFDDRDWETLLVSVSNPVQMTDTTADRRPDRQWNAQDERSGNIGHDLLRLDSRARIVRDRDERAVLVILAIFTEHVVRGQVYEAGHRVVCTNYVLKIQDVLLIRPVGVVFTSLDVADSVRVYDRAREIPEEFGHTGVVFELDVGPAESARVSLVGAVNSLD